ncbi:hypothetical protein CDAR_470101 [Caerostris darwini]|uniref:Uncharacterized protein n=1 Tax=Caerostris darwini TaxID=1538125 RepID=A0AAV4W913_9ARAC|nr:hypothetical protein CDAR_470101 [Caerostris darwini]
MFCLGRARTTSVSPICMMPHPTASIRRTFLNFSFKAFHPHPITHISNLTMPFFSIPSHQASSLDTVLESREKMSPSRDDSNVFARFRGQKAGSPPKRIRNTEMRVSQTETRPSTLSGRHGWGSGKSASLVHPFWIESVYECLSGQITSDVMNIEL